MRSACPDTFDQPSGIAIAPNGDIFVTDRHGKNDRVLKFSKDGRFIKTWGHHGAESGEFDQPHDISIGGSQGRVFVADRSNSRVEPKRHFAFGPLCPRLFLNACIVTRLKVSRQL